MKRRSLVLVAFLFEGALLLLALGLGWISDTPPFASAELDLPALVLGALGVVPLLVALAWTLRSSVPFLARLRRQLDDILPLFADATAGDLALISLLAGICEEVLFRGVIQIGLTSVVGVMAALLVTSILFGAAHYVSFTYAAMVFFVSLYLGALLLFSGNLLVPITTHAIYDFLALTYLVKRYTPAQVGEVPERAPGEGQTEKGEPDRAA